MRLQQGQLKWANSQAQHKVIRCKAKKSHSFGHTCKSKSNIRHEVGYVIARSSKLIAMLNYCKVDGLGLA